MVDVVTAGTLRGTHNDGKVRGYYTGLASGWTWVKLDTTNTIIMWRKSLT